MHSYFVLHLPNEILAIIINELTVDNEDKDVDKDKILLAALASCRLASHVLCSLATPLFFSSILLTDAYDHDYGISERCSLLVKRATKLNDILATRSIAASIHSLTVSLHYHDQFSNKLIPQAALSCLPSFPAFHIFRNFPCKSNTAHPFVRFQWISQQPLKLCADLQILRHCI